LSLIEASNVFPAPIRAITHDRLKSYLVLVFRCLRRELIKGILRHSPRSNKPDSPLCVDRERKFR